MLSFFRRKKPETAASPDAKQRLGIEELAAAFPVHERSDAPHDDAALDNARSDTTGIDTSTQPAVSEPAVEHITPAAANAAISEAIVDAAATGATQPVPPEVIAAALEDEMPADIVVEHAPAALQPASAPEPDSAPAVGVAPPSGPVTAAIDAGGDVPAFGMPAEAERPAAPAGNPGWRDRLRNSVFARSLGGLFSRNPKLDDDLLDEIETALITADVGVAATSDLVEDLRRRMKSREFADANGLLAALRADLVALLKPVAQPLRIDSNARPFVLLTVGVNGVGKTTTIGKLAKRFKDEQRSLMLAAGDTFRAAAVAQLQSWGERNGVPVVAQGQNADAASVAFDALQAAKARGTEVLIADTAGRLHTQQGLMAELGKIKRVLQKLDATAPHEVLMVIDGTTGQNALSQLRQFHAAVGVTGLVVTKLDGTAKGGVVFALAREFGVPIRFAGIGERPEDLRVFDAEAFVDALLPEALGG
ncbi:signal recognition particle-docking protein FtsY [Montanilutibacter psychrotolerans]|uniref:Signal recognition particle receptor FtsY n=1 Tax=Montanilutibacter psychrotolerans TaxID=1327343 RepID=A0A3M8SYF9_9GAMM|nr:signal recognition particle-docking protein FtsY [Lysobacter psychrotolerans]RNF86279.1 signal recognition particle-docking protein FtsY [Lysobacter psychrotolerans]